MVTEWVDGSNGGDWRSGLPAIIQKRIDRFEVKAVNGHQALFEALRDLLIVAGEGDARGRAIDLLPKRYVDKARSAIAEVTGARSSEVQG